MLNTKPTTREEKLLKPKTLFFSILAIILLVFTVIDLYAMTNPQQFRYGPVLWAETLSSKPEKYFVLTDPDPYVLEAISDPGSSGNLGRLVFIGSWDNTNIDELVHSYKTNDALYNDAYYTIHTESADNLTYGTAFLFLIFFWICLGVGFGISQVRARPS